MQDLSDSRDSFARFLSERSDKRHNGAADNPPTTAHEARPKQGLMGRTGRLHPLGTTRSPETGKSGGWAAKVAGEPGRQRTLGHLDL